MRTTMFQDYHQKQPKKNLLLRILIGILFCIAAMSICIILGYSLNNSVVLERQSVTIANLSKDLDGFTILHISDLNGKASIIEKKEIHTLLRGKTYHAVCFTGNMMGSAQESEAFFELIRQLQSLNSTVPIYYLPGTEDPHPLVSKPSGSDNILAEHIRELNAMGVTLVDRPIALKRKTNKIWFSPEYLYSIDPAATLNAMTAEIKRMESEGNLFDEQVSLNYKQLSYRSRVMESALDAQKITSDKDVQVILSSYPLSAEYISNTIRYNSTESLFSMKYAHLLLAGSLVGGQWQLPGGIPIYVPEYGFFPSRESIYGKSRILTLEQYISPGLSASSIYPYPKIRVFNSPTITLIKLTSKY